MTSFDGKCQYLQTSVFTFLIFAKIRPVRMNVTHRDTKTDKAMVIGEIAKNNTDRDSIKRGITRARGVINEILALAL